MTNLMTNVSKVMTVAYRFLAAADSKRKVLAKIFAKLDSGRNLNHDNVFFHLWKDLVEEHYGV
jgi:hypothetical protein